MGRQYLLQRDNGGLNDRGTPTLPWLTFVHDSIADWGTAFISSYHVTVPGYTVTHLVSFNHHNPLFSEVCCHPFLTDGE